MQNPGRCLFLMSVAQDKPDTVDETRFRIEHDIRMAFSEKQEMSHQKSKMSHQKINQNKKTNQLVNLWVNF